MTHYFWRDLKDGWDVPEGSLYWIGWGASEDWIQEPLPLEEGTDVPTAE